jgi:hypothetical protein
MLITGHHELRRPWAIVSINNTEHAAWKAVPDGQQIFETVGDNPEEKTYLRDRESTSLKAELELALG